MISESSEIVNLPITGTLDLHNFNPKEIKDLVNEYLLECQKARILSGRIIHGKGMGTLQKTVRSILDKNNSVLGFQLGNESNGGWGSTSFQLKPLD